MTENLAPTRGALELLVDRTFGPYFGGKLISSFGMWIQNLGSSVLMFDLTGFAFMVGMVSVMQFLPAALFALFAGALTDQFDRRRLLILGRTVAGGAVLVLAALLTVLGTEGFGGPIVLLALVFVAGLGWTLSNPAQQALLPSLVPMADLETALALNASGPSIARTVGPALGALLLVAGPHMTFWVGGLAHLAFAAVLVFIRGRPQELPRQRPSVWGGLRYLRDDRKAMALMIGVAFVAIGADPVMTLSPSIAAELDGGDQAVGILVFAFGLGAVSFTLTVRLIRQVLGLRILGVLGFWTLATGLVVVGLAGHLWVAAAGFVLAGAGFMMGSVTLNTRIQRRGNRTYEYLSLVEAFRGDDGKKRHSTLFRLGQASALRETGELDRIIAALTAHAQRCYVDVDGLEVDGAPMLGTMAAVRRLWDELGLEELFEQLGGQVGCAFSLADAVFAMLAGRLVDPASKRRTHRWIVEDVVAPDGFSFPTLDQYYRALDVVCDHTDTIERHVYAAVCDLTNLNLTLACYDLTSSYLEGDPAPQVRFPSKAFGYSRDRRSDRPQVVIGLLTSADGIPIAHHVFSGDTGDSTTLTEVLADLVARFAVGRICVVADRGLISEANITEVEDAGCDWLFATKLRNRNDVAAVLAAAAAADEGDWVEVERFGSHVLDTDHDGRRYVVVFSQPRERRDIHRRLELINKVETRLLDLEARVKRGDLVEATKIAAATATILARFPVKRLFDVTDIAEGRFVYDYDHDALAYDEALAGHYVLATSLTPTVADAGQVLAAYRSLQHVENRFRVLKSALGLRPIRHFTEPRVRGHIAICVLAAVIESLIGNRLRDADIRDPDLPDQHLTADRAIQELDRIRQVTFTAGDTTIDAVTRRTDLQQQIGAGLGVDTRAWAKPTITG